MTFGKDIFCHGIEPYNFRDTDETVATITANVGQSTAIGPKVAIRHNKPFPKKGNVVGCDMGESSASWSMNVVPTVTCTHGGEPVIGTIDASIYLKNNNQDNTKYIIKRKTEMQKRETEVIQFTESLLEDVKSGKMSVEEMGMKIAEMMGIKVDANNKEYDSIADAIKDINRDAPHQQDQLNCQDEAASHLTKTVCEGIDEEGEEVCTVRRLIPTETATLQGFPAEYTKIDGPDTSDAPQYKSHGNSWATPCANHMSTRMEMEMRRLGHKGTIKYATCCSGIEAQSVAVKNLDWESVFFSEIEPFPCRVLEHHYPKTPNLGDMTQIHYDSEKGVITNSHAEGEEYFLPKEFKVAPIQEIPFKEGDLQVFSGGTPCFARGVCVLTKTGYKPIENIKVGDEVATHKGRFRKVSKIGKKLSSDLVEVSIVGRSRFVCTADHPFPLLRSHRRKSGKIYFASPVLMPIKDGQSLYVQMVNAGNEDFGVAIPQLPRVYNASNSEIYELCGWYVGDGYIRGWKGKSKKAIILCLNAKDIAVFNERFAGKINYTILKSAGIFKVQICCTEFARFLHNHFGELAHGKKIPMWAYNKEVRENFIRGYFQTDGCFTRGGHSIQWSTVSQSLAYGIADIVGHTCVNLSVMPKTTTICGRIVNQRDFYTVRHNDAANHFHKVGKFDCVKVREVNRLNGKTDWVYNLEVEEDHTYIVNGLVTHNCQSISVAGKREGMAEGSGTRSSLAFHFQRIIDETKPMFTLWENVPGAFSSNGGADFIWFVNKCAESGYSMAWRVLDAQYTMTEEFPRAVPQRRRRIWLVGYKGNDWRVPARIVFETEKSLTSNPPERVPGIGFKTLSAGWEEVVHNRAESAGESAGQEIAEGDLFGGSAEVASESKLLKVSTMIPFEDMPLESDFSQVSTVDIYTFAKLVGEPGYIGSVFRTDKKVQKKTKKEDTFDLFAMEVGIQPTEPTEEETIEEEEWVGAEKINPAVLENIGNAGIMANGRVCTLKCHEWTSGIQLSPETAAKWGEYVKNKEWEKANEVLPVAYDGTVCGLSDVLEDDPSEKYNLSWRACFGILKRAETRGKALPPALEMALVSTIREYAGIVKWVVLNGKDTTKKAGDLTEKEIAKLCYDKYIAPVKHFEEVEAISPATRGGEETESDDGSDEGEIEEDEEGNPVVSGDCFQEDEEA